MILSNHKNKLLGYFYIVSAVMSMIILAVLIIIAIYNNYTLLLDEHAAYNSLLDRREGLSGLHESKKIIESEFKARSDIFLFKNNNDGYTFFEGKLSDLIIKHNGTIISSVRLNYKDINGITPIGFRTMFRLKDSELVAFFKELDKTLLKRAAIETIKIAPTYPERVNYEPIVDISVDFIMFCKKTEI